MKYFAMVLMLLCTSMFVLGCAQGDDPAPPVDPAPVETPEETPEVPEETPEVPEETPEVPPETPEPTPPVE